MCGGVRGCAGDCGGLWGTAQGLCGGVRGSAGDCGGLREMARPAAEIANCQEPPGLGISRNPGKHESIFALCNGELNTHELQFLHIRLICLTSSCLQAPPRQQDTSQAGARQHSF